MKRKTIFWTERGVMMVEEHLAKQPSGNAAQRARAVKSGWKPTWIAEGRPKPFFPAAVQSKHVELHVLTGAQ